MVHSNPRTPVAGAQSAEHSIVSDYLEFTLRQIPTIFGRLVYTASLWDPNSGSYRHHPLCKVVSALDVDASLRLIHLNVFRQWLALNLRQQRGDLMRYLDYDEADAWQILTTWNDRGLLENLPPTAAPRHEGQLYRGDISLVLESLRAEAGVNRVA
jgi:hypothetical protein